MMSSLYFGQAILIAALSDHCVSLRKRLDLVSWWSSAFPTRGRALTQSMEYGFPCCLPWYRLLLALQGSSIKLSLQPLPAVVLFIRLRSRGWFWLKRRSQSDHSVPIPEGCSSSLYRPNGDWGHQISKRSVSRKESHKSGTQRYHPLARSFVHLLCFIKKITSLFCTIHHIL